MDPEQSQAITGFLSKNESLKDPERLTEFQRTAASIVKEFGQGLEQLQKDEQPVLPQITNCVRRLQDLSLSAIKESSPCSSDIQSTLCEVRTLIQKLCNPLESPLSSADQQELQAFLTNINDKKLSQNQLNSHEKFEHKLQLLVDELARGYSLLPNFCEYQYFNKLMFALVDLLRRYGVGSLAAGGRNCISPINETGTFLVKRLKENKYIGMFKHLFDYLLANEQDSFLPVLKECDKLYEKIQGLGLQDPQRSSYRFDLYQKLFEAFDKVKESLQNRAAYVRIVGEEGAHKTLEEFCRTFSDVLERICSFLPEFEKERASEMETYELYQPEKSERQIEMEKPVTQQLFGITKTGVVAFLSEAITNTVHHALQYAFEMYCVKTVLSTHPHFLSTKQELQSVIQSLEYARDCPKPFLKSLSGNNPPDQTEGLQKIALQLLQTAPVIKNQPHPLVSHIQNPSPCFVATVESKEVKYSYQQLVKILAFIINCDRLVHAEADIAQAVTDMTELREFIEKTNKEKTILKSPLLPKTAGSLERAFTSLCLLATAKDSKICNKELVATVKGYKLYPLVESSFLLFAQEKIFGPFHTALGKKWYNAPPLAIYGLLIKALKQLSSL